MIETISNYVRKARIEHRCDWCLKKINKGEEYDYTVHKYNGTLFTWKNHLGCRELHNKLDMGSNEFDNVVSSYDFMEIIAEFLYHNLSEEEFDEVIMNNKEVETALRLIRESEIDE